MALDAREIRPGLWRWTAPHPEWKPEKGGPGGWEQMVGCVYYEAPRAVVLIDPLAPPEATREHERFWSALDRDVARHGTPVVMFLANHYHERSVREVYERYEPTCGAAVWAHEAARGRVSCPLTHTFHEGDALPGDIKAYGTPSLNEDEVVYYLPEHRAIVAADALIGAGGGKLQIPPASWAEGGEAGQARYRKEFRASLRRLLDVPLDMVLVSHGEPVLEGGRDALAAALEGPEWGE